jgi:ketosteroid isomerase-like protein
VHLIEFRGDKIVRFQEFFDTYAAAEAFRSEPERGGEAA